MLNLKVSVQTSEPSGNTEEQLLLYDHQGLIPTRHQGTQLIKSDPRNSVKGSKQNFMPHHPKVLTSAIDYVCMAPWISGKLLPNPRLLMALPHSLRTEASSRSIEPYHSWIHHSLAVSL